VSIRRLSPNQPASFEFRPEFLKQAKQWIANYPPGKQQSAVIPLLENATFYTMFMLEPVGTHALVQVCGTTPCMVRGAGELIAVCKRRIGPHDHRSADGKLYWQEVECMGACANAPMAAINDYYYEDLDAASFEKLLDQFAAGEKPKPGSARGRLNAAPEGGPTTLSDESLFDGSLSKPVTIPNLPAKEPA